MTIGGLISEVRNNWPAYRQLKKVSKDQLEYKLVVVQFPSELRSLLVKGPDYDLQGSTGRGIITAAPWIATLDKSITKTATQGFYVVYLYSIDLKRLYLSLAFGTTQFKEYFPRTLERHAKLLSAAAHLTS
jgi:MrcB-like, N-terminal domain